MPMIYCFFIHKDLHILKSVLEQEIIFLMKWFENSFMKTNPEVFQAICVGKKPFEGIGSFNIQNLKIK